MSRRERVARLLCGSGLDVLARLSWRGTLVLNFHRIGTPAGDEDPDLYSCTLEELDAYVGALTDRFEIVPAGTCDLTSGERGRRIALTFDDGYREHLAAARVLAAHGVVGSFFVTTGFVDEPVLPWWDEIARLVSGITGDLPDSPWTPGGLALRRLGPDDARRAVGAAYKTHAGSRGPEFLAWLAAAADRPRPAPAEGADLWLTWPLLRELRAAGMEIGGHTVTHPILATLPADRQEAEIGDSLRRLRDEVGGPVTTFAYPVGARTSFDHRTRAALRRHGVSRAFSFCGGYNRRGGRHDPFNVLRAGVFCTDSTATIRATAALPAVFASPRHYA